ncbi:hypothetical protein M3223_09235 [Paenibacillus pasadenensis]|nr:hypothetical protein [Paenibacillus pasadenensis]
MPDISGASESGLHWLGETAAQAVCTRPGAPGDEPDSALCYKGPERSGLCRST